MIYDLIIIGSGPAGLSAAIYGKRAGLELLVIEKNYMSGGQILNTYEVDNYLGLPGMNGFDMGMQFREHADKLGVEHAEGEVIGLEDGSIKKVITTSGEYEAYAVILATGAVHGHLNVAGEERLTGRGVSYCATCDGAFYRGKTVAVVGGGNVALEDAVYLARFCEKVYLIHRRDEFRGEKILQSQVEALENIEVLFSHTVQEICGEEQVSHLILKDVKSEQEKELQVDGIFIAVGIIPATSWIRDFIKKDEKGYVVANEEGETSAKGIYVAGDIRTKALRQIITAVSDGANAAVNAGAYINRTKIVK